MIAAIPYVRSRTRGVVDTTLNRTHIFGRTVRKLRSYIEIPAFDIANTWRGASEVIYRLEFATSTSVSLLERFPITAPAGANFVPVVAWLEDEVFHRYKLWSDVGEILWLPTYAKQKINQTYFFIEIWNTDTRTPYILDVGGSGLEAGEDAGLFVGYSDPLNLLLAEAIRVTTSQLIIPTHLCDEDDVNLAAATVCEDPIFHLEDFEPLYGDYYIFSGHCARELIKGTRAKPTYNLIQNRDDETWHYVWIAVVDGNAYFHVDPTNQVPPVDALGYFPTIIAGYPHQAVKIELENGPDGTGNYFVADTLLDDTDDAVDLNLIQDIDNQDDNHLRGVRVIKTGTSQYSIDVIQEIISL